MGNQRKERWIPKIACIVSGFFVVASVLGACRGVEGEMGAFSVRVFAASTTTGITLTELGIPVNGTVPSSSERYYTDELKGRVYWSTTTPANYRLNISKKAEEGEKGEDGLLPYNEVLQLPPLTATKGEDGEDQDYLFYFNDNSFFVLISRKTVTGTVF